MPIGNNKLPHFTNIGVAEITNEAVYPSLFEIAFIFPQILQDQGRDPISMLESAKSVELPIHKEIEAKSQRYKYSTRVYLTLPPDTHYEFGIKFNLNVNKNGSIFQWNTLRAWYNLVWNSQTGSANIKSNMCGTIIVNQHDKEGFVLRRVTYQNVQMKFLDNRNLDWDQVSEIMEPIEAKFVADYAIDEYIDNNFEITPPKLY